jgi:hypothetical protein
MKVRVVSPETCAWTHHRTERGESDRRDRRILLKWLADEPTNPRALALSGAEEVRRGNARRAARQFGKYLASPLTAERLGAARMAAARSALGRLERGGPFPGAAGAITFGGPA